MKGRTVKNLIKMKKVKQVIFFLTVVAVFTIVGSMEQGYCTPEAGMALAAANFVLMYWSGFGSGLLRKEDGK